MTLITLTAEKIKQIAGNKNRLHNHQLMVLGEYPPTKGWQNRLIGKSITENEFEMLVRARDLELEGNELKPNLSNREALLFNYEYELIKNER